MKKPNTFFLVILAAGITAVYLSAAKNLGYLPFPYSIQPVKNDQGLPMKDVYMKNGRVAGVARDYFADGRLLARTPPTGAGASRAHVPAWGIARMQSRRD